MIAIFAEASTNGTYPNWVGSLTLVVVAVLQGVSMWRANQNHRINRREIAEVKEATSDIKKSVDGPLGLALSSAASAQEALARLTHDPHKILEAVAARKLSDDHNASQAVFVAALKKSDAEKQAIIKEFLAKQRGEETK